MIPLTAFLLFASILFGIGLYGAMTKRNAVRILMSIELMLNAANINLVAFNVYGPLKATSASELNLTRFLFGGQTLTFFAILLAAAEAAVGLSILLILYRNWNKIDISEMDLLSG